SRSLTTPSPLVSTSGATIGAAITPELLRDELNCHLTFGLKMPGGGLYLLSPPLLPTLFVSFSSGICAALSTNAYTRLSRNCTTPETGTTSGEAPPLGILAENVPEPRILSTPFVYV